MWTRYFHRPTTTERGTTVAEPICDYVQQLQEPSLLAILTFFDIRASSFCAWAALYQLGLRNWALESCLPITEPTILPTLLFF